MSKVITFQMLEEEQFNKIHISPGTLISGKIVDINGDYAIIDAGLKSECRVPVKQFISDEGENNANIGDEYEFLLETIDDGHGATIMSREKAIRSRAWAKIADMFEQEQLVTGTICERKKGGFFVNIGALKAFLPSSHAFIKSVREQPEDLEGQVFNFKIVKMEKRRNNIVVSRRLVHEQEAGEDRRELLEAMKIGDIVSGTVKNLTEYGAFIDLGGVDGLLHITDISWKRLRHPSEVIKVGEQINVKVLNHDRDNNRVSLGLKQMVDDPWVNIDRRYPIKSRVFGKVTNMLDYGCFIEIEDGIEGLVHMSEMDWANKNIHPSKLLSLGDEVEVMVLDIDVDRRRISLGIKQCKENPWLEFAQNYQVGDQVSGEVKSKTDFGVFIGLPGGIDGLIHVNDLTWKEDPQTMLSEITKGDELKAVILTMDIEKERISLGVKQLEDNPFDDFLTSNSRGSRVVITIESIEDGKILGKTSGDLPIVIKRLSDGFNANVGDHLEVFYQSYDRKLNALVMSLTEIKRSVQKSDYSDIQSSGEKSGVSFGDLIKKELDQHNDDSD